MQRRSLILFVALNVLISVGVALAVIQLVGSRQTPGTETVFATLEVIITATPGPTQTPFIITATPPEGVVLLPTGLLPSSQNVEQTRAAAPTIDPAVLSADQSLQGTVTSLPDNCILHTVVDGDTPFGIAEQYGTDGFLLMEVNGLTEETASFLQIGQVLIVPLDGCTLTQNVFGDTTTETAAETEAVVPTDTPAVIQTTPTAAAPTNAPTATATATLPPTAENAQMEILGVQNAGTVTQEYIEVRNNGNTVNISGWRIRDGQGNEYTFAEQFLFNRGSIRVYTGSGGSDTATVKYWRQPQAIWTSGDTATLLDSEGSVQSVYVIP